MDVLKLLKEQILEIYPVEWEIEETESSLEMVAPWMPLRGDSPVAEYEGYLFDYFLFKGYEKFKCLRFYIDPGPVIYGDVSFVGGRMSVTPVYGRHQRVILEAELWT